MCLRVFKYYFQYVFQGLEKKKAHGNGENSISWTTVQPFSFFICFAFAKCSAFIRKAASSCLFPRPWGERTLQIWRAPSQGFHYQSTQLRQCSPKPICRKCHGGPQCHGNRETCSQWWRLLWVEGRDELVNWTKRLAYSPDTLQKYLLCLSQKAVWRFKWDNVYENLWKTTQNITYIPYPSVANQRTVS